ncbi:MAG: para-aminobenzoate synthetase component 1 [Myxococcota bacterium]|jgi:para-aminobenzoate synthetase component 1
MIGSPSLAEVLDHLRQQDHLAVFDLGAAWTVVTWAEAPATIDAAPDWITAARAALQPRPPQPLLPFSGGLVGWLGYEAGRFTERMPPPRADPPAATLRLWRCEGGLCLHHPTGEWHIGGTPDFTARARALLDQPTTPLRPAAKAPGAPLSPEPHEAARYQQGVREILSAIRAGDVYQACLAWEQRGVPITDPTARWLDLREANPAEQGALLRSGAHTVISNSPELYLSVSPEGRLRSVPIKGTARVDEGDAGRQRLWTSEKERAELTMIVDLVRNDLGRVAATGSVRAADRQLRRCGDLLHAEQAVTAILREGADAFDAVAASFPPGSVTGAPKVAAMQLIAALEPGPRGVYTGAIGFFGDDGAAHLSVAIRTATVTDGLARFHIGAGIVADSQPALEWEETLAKGRALAAWLGAR